ncbi:leukocyte cysteine proteinase inhibitor 1-like isoform X4 [Lithobates pipiens]
MSDVGKSERPIPGGWTDSRPSGPEDQAILDKVKEEFQRRIDSLLPISKFLALLVRTQIVGGTKYLFLVDIGQPDNICLYVILPLDQEPILKEILQATKIDEDPLDL